MKKLLSLFTLIALLAPLPAFALDLHDARAQGLVGEKLDGFVTALKPSAEVNALVDEVNSRRRADYQATAKAQGQTVDVVGRSAAELIAGKLGIGCVVSRR